MPEAQELPDRLRPVLAVVDLVDNAGLSGPADPGLCIEAIWLARILAALLPDEPEVAGLLALLLLVESRRRSRLRPDGSLVVLGEQDRTRWDRALLAEGQATSVAAVAATSPVPISSRRPSTPGTPQAATVEETDWPQIVALYDQLLGSPHPGWWPSTAPAPSASSRVRPPRWPW